MASIYPKRGWLYLAATDETGQRRGIALGMRDTPENRVAAQEIKGRLPTPPTIVRVSKKKHEVSIVYFVREGGKGYIKIGVSVGLPSRLSELDMASPHVLTLLAVTLGGRETEKALHERFAAARVKGEWFEPVPELLEFIAKIRI